MKKHSLTLTLLVRAGLLLLLLAGLTLPHEPVESDLTFDELQGDECREGLILEKVPGGYLATHPETDTAGLFGLSVGYSPDFRCRLLLPSECGPDQVYVRYIDAFALAAATCHNGDFLTNNPSMTLVSTNPGGASSILYADPDYDCTGLDANSPSGAGSAHGTSEFMWSGANNVMPGFTYQVRVFDTSTDPYTEIATQSVPVNTTQFEFPVETFAGVTGISWDVILFDDSNPPQPRCRAVANSGKSIPIVLISGIGGNVPQPPLPPDCSGFALTSPTDGMGYVGTTVYWNDLTSPPADPHNYQVRIYDQFSNALVTSANADPSVGNAGFDLNAILRAYSDQFVPLLRVEVSVIMNGLPVCNDAAVNAVDLCTYQGNCGQPSNGGGDSDDNDEDSGGDSGDDTYTPPDEDTGGDPPSGET